MSKKSKEMADQARDELEKEAKKRANEGIDYAQN